MMMTMISSSPKLFAMALDDSGTFVLREGLIWKLIKDMKGAPLISLAMYMGVWRN